MATNTKTNYQLHLRGFVGGEDFNTRYVDFILSENEGKEGKITLTNSQFDSLEAAIDADNSLFSRLMSRFRRSSVSQRSTSLARASSLNFVAM